MACTEEPFAVCINARRANSCNSVVVACGFSATSL